MRWKTKSRGRNYVVWHRWFAWFPVKTEDGWWIWLERVWRIGYRQTGGLTEGTIRVWKYSSAQPHSATDVI